VPNMLTGARLAAVPGLLASWHAEAPGVAAGLFCAAAVTDFLDGYLARRLGQHSALGALLDPLADKLLVAAALLVLVEHGGHAAVTVPAAAILGRELAVSSLREWVQARRPGAMAGVAVAWHGKAKAALQLLALQAMLLGVALEKNGPEKDEVGSGEGTPASLAYKGGLGLLWLAAAASLASGAQYTRAAFSLR